MRQLTKDTPTMRPLPEALARVAEGWNPSTEIHARAALMRGHAEAGNFERAEEYAVEIEVLQATKNGPPREWPAWATHERKLGYAAWARVLNHGYLRGRTFWMDDAASLLGWAQTLYPNHPLTEKDIL